MIEKSESYQRQFFDRLADQFKGRADMVSQLCLTLHLGKDAVYRRIRGDTSLTADELMLLSDTFGVKLQTTRRNIPVLGYPLSQLNLSSEVDYVKRLRENVHEIVNIPEVSVDYASPDLPLFYEMSTPTLLGFKMFMYGITTWGLGKFSDKPFSPSLIDPDTYHYADKLVSDVCRLPGRELWSIRILDVTLRQIAYVHQVGRFANTQIVRDLFRELGMIVDHLESMARRGKRFRMGSQPSEGSPDFAVYLNELSNTSNAVIIKAPARTYLFSVLVSPNYIVATDDKVVRDVQFWFDQQVRMGTRLSMDSAKHTSRYFEQLRQQLASYERTTLSDSSEF